MSIRIIESQDARLLAELNHDVQELHAGSLYNYALRIGQKRFF